MAIPLKHPDFNEDPFPIAINGFWRSGTTWVLELVSRLLQARAVFEPLCVRWKPYHALFQEYPGLPSTTFEYGRHFMPYFGDSLAPWHDYYQLFGRSFSGELRGSWIQRAEVVSYPLPGRVVVKFVRGHLCLPMLYRTFSVPIIHIWRDPRAIFSSLQKNDWKNNWHETLNLETLMLAPRDGRECYFRQYKDKIIRLNQCSFAARLTAYWALAELFVRDHMDIFPHNKLAVLGYHHLVTEGPTVLEDTVRKFGMMRLASIDKDAIDAPSATSSSRDEKKVLEQRLYGWKNLLNAGTRSEIERVTMDFGLDARLIDPKT